jgi:hypothetical protein
MPVVEHLGRERVRVGGLSLADQPVRRNEGDPALPDRRGPDPAVQRRPVPVEEVAADDLRCAAVDEVPVVDAVEVGDVSLVYLCVTVRLAVVAGAFGVLRQQHQTGESVLVDRAAQSGRQRARVDRVPHQRPDQLSDPGQLDPDEPVALAVAAGTYLEVAGQLLGGDWVALGVDLLQQGDDPVPVTHAVSVEPA